MKPSQNKADDLAIEASRLVGGYGGRRLTPYGEAMLAAQQIERAKIKKVLEGVLIPVAHEMLKCYGGDHQHYIDINEMWIDLFDEQLFPSANDEHRDGLCPFRAAIGYQID